MASAAVGMINFNACFADPVVWLDDNVTLHGRTVFYVAPVQNTAGKTLSSDVLSLITSELTATMKRAELTVLDKQDASRDSITISSELTDYDPGNASKRWLFPGAGATVCTLRITLVDDKTGKTLGEIDDGGSVSTGGLFSIGTENSLPKRVADEVANKLIELINQK